MADFFIGNRSTKKVEGAANCKIQCAMADVGKQLQVFIRADAAGVSHWLLMPVGKNLYKLCFNAGGFSLMVRVYLMSVR